MFNLFLMTMKYKHEDSMITPHVMMLLVTCLLYLKTKFFQPEVLELFFSQLVSVEF